MEQNQSLRTVCIGSWPKPAWLFSGIPSHSGDGKGQIQTGWQSSGEQLNVLQDAATEWAINEQMQAGSDVVTDGEQRRENYIWYHVKKAMLGVDFKVRTQKMQRGGVEQVHAPTVTSRVSVNQDNLGFLVEDWNYVQSRITSGATAMVSMPGPMTLTDSLCCTKEWTDQAFYESKEECAMDFAKVLNMEIKALVAAGCKFITIDEPVFVRYPDDVKAWGIRAMDACFDGVDMTGVSTMCHICCSYPSCPQKADYRLYKAIAPDLCSSRCLQSFSIEHAFRQLDLSQVLPPFASSGKIVVLGMCQIGDDQVESQAEITRQIKAALHFIPPTQLWLAPDCGCVLLSPEAAKAKISNIAAAARSVRRELLATEQTAILDKVRGLVNLDAEAAN